MELNVPCGPTIILCENFSVDQIKERLRTLLMYELYNVINKIDQHSYRFIKPIFLEPSVESQLLDLVIFNQSDKKSSKDLLYAFLWDAITKNVEAKLARISANIKSLDYEESIKEDLILNYSVFIKSYSTSKSSKDKNQ